MKADTKEQTKTDEEKPEEKPPKDKGIEPAPKDPEGGTDPPEDEDRETWGNQIEFFLSCLGYAVGFGNVWRFPYLCYKNGGAAFLIPYVIMLLCAGLPLFFMELALGQYISLGPNILFPKLAPIFYGLGWAMVLVSMLVAVYYNVILAWALYYLFSSFTSELPWSNCDNDYNTAYCYKVEDARNCTDPLPYYFNKTCYSVEEYCSISGLASYNETFCEDATGNVTLADSTLGRLTPSEDFFQNRMLKVAGTSWDNMGGMQWEIVGCLALAWIIVGLCMMKGVKSSGKVVYVTATFPYIVLIILFGRGVTLEGARKGIDFYFLKPNITQLQNVEVWSDAASQIFYSLGSAFGGLITLASYNKFKNNCMRDAVLIAVSNCLTSVFAGFVIFSILGFLATELGVEVSDVANSGSGLAFVAYPSAVARMPVAPLWSILFFIMLVTLGLDSQFTMVETLVTALLDQFKVLRPKKILVVSIICFILFLLGLTMCLEGGVYMFELFFFFSSNLSVIIIAIVEIAAVQYVYGFKNFISNIREEMGIHMYPPVFGYWAATWFVITPLSLLVILVFSIIFYVPAYWGTYVFPDSIQVLGWLLCFSSVVVIPLGTMYVICCKGKRSLHDLFKVSPDFCPRHIRKQRETKADDFVSKVYQNLAFDKTSEQTQVTSIKSKEESTCITSL